MIAGVLCCNEVTSHVQVIKQPEKFTEVGKLPLAATRTVLEVQQTLLTLSNEVRFLYRNPARDVAAAP